MTTAIALKAIMVMGRPSVWPSSCSRWLRPKRVKSGMFRLSVAQKPTMAVRLGTNTFQKSADVAKVLGRSNIGPRPPARMTTHTISQTPRTRTSGALQFSNTRTAFIPNTMMPMFTSQKMPKVMALGTLRPRMLAPPPMSVKAGQTAVRKVRTASPPMKVWMPNHPQATIARSSAGTLAPIVPKLLRASTGNGMPYLVPGCALSRIGISTIRLPSAMVSSACHQFMPSAIRPPASM